MNPLLIALLVGLLIGVLLSFKLFAKPLERRRITSYEFPEGWSQNLYNKFPLSFEIGTKTKNKFFKEIQWALSDKEFFPLGDKNLEGLDCVYLCAPFLLFETHSTTKPLKGVKRFLVLDESFQGEQPPKEDGHDFSVFYARHSCRVQAPHQEELETRTQKVITQLFGRTLAQNFNQKSFLRNYAYKYKRTQLLRAVDALTPILKSEFYLSDNIDEELLIWKLHEIFCYSTEEMKKALPKTYQGLMEYYQLKQ